MKVAISVTKIVEVGNMSLAELERRCSLAPGDNECIDWYDIEPEQEIWSYAIVEK